ncbi:MAG TPA: BON domain-containing protein [Bryobacteraceae bacterium]|jgi:hypothetical protein|nr:BON domain-containing protein [Bryobacteraceae bacterium]
MKRMRGVFFAAALIAVGITAGCGGGKSANDQTLTNEIQSKLYSDATTKPANVTVAVKDGVVTLGGSVASPDVELQAMKIANATPGVKSVTDQIKVDPSLASNLPNAGNAQPQQQPEPPASTPPPQQAAAQSPAPAPAAAAPAPEQPARREHTRVTIPAGAELSVRMIDSINSAKNTSGQTFRASLAAPVEHDGEVILPAGTPVTVLLSEAKGAGRIQGSSLLEVRASSIDYHGRSYPITTSAYEEQGKGRGKQTAIRSGIGAAAGAVIGAIAGGGKGAAIGSLAGGGAGAGYQLATHGQQVTIPSETVLNFKLDAPVSIRK